MIALYRHRRLKSTERISGDALKALALAWLKRFEQHGEAIRIAAVLKLARHQYWRPVLNWTGGRVRRRVQRQENVRLSDPPCLFGRTISENLMLEIDPAAGDIRRCVVIAQRAALGDGRLILRI